MTMFIGQLALVTGGSQGIGRAIAQALAVAGATVIIVGRRPDPVTDAVALIRGAGGSADGLALDLVKTEDRATLVADIDGRSAGPDVLVPSAGTIARADVATASMTDLDHQYESNVRAPIALTQSLLPCLRRARGHIVFVNSTAGLVARANASQFAATQHAMRAFATALRDEVNKDGIRVTMVFPGRTATARQERIHGWEGKPYRPELLLQPEDIASIVLAAINLPRTAEVTELTIRSMAKT
jgi:NADP-dependent 3-hydroxy acid dehydrogenase YdfG